MTLLELRDVSRRFGALQVLNGINLAVEQGELRAVIGPNGAGKTTLFNLITGRFPPSTGHISFGGKDITGMPPRRVVAEGIIRTFQITEIFHDLTVYKNIRVAVETAKGYTRMPFLGAAKRAAVQREVEELLATVHLESKADHVAGELAHGDQRTVEMAITLTREPRLLLLDEPTAGMGDDETHHMVGIIRRLHKERGITILFIEHDMDIIFGVADRITVLDNGHMLAEGTPDEIAANPTVQAAYLGNRRSILSPVSRLVKTPRPVPWPAQTVPPPSWPASAAPLVSWPAKAGYPRLAPAVRNKAAGRMAQTREGPPHDPRPGSRGPARLLRQEPHPARRLAARGGRRTGRAARPQRRRQDHDLACDDRPDPAAPGACPRLRHRRHPPPDAPHHAAGSRLRAGRPQDVRPPDGGGKPARAEADARTLVDQHDFPAVPAPGGAPHQQGRHAVRRRAGNAGDRRALLLNPKLLLMDEPSQGLAPLIVDEVMRSVDTMRAEGTAILLVEQNAFLALELANRAYVISDGQIVHEGPAAELLHDTDKVVALAGASSSQATAKSQ